MNCNDHINHKASSLINSHCLDFIYPYPEEQIDQVHTTIFTHLIPNIVWVELLLWVGSTIQQCDPGTGNFSKNEKQNNLEGKNYLEFYCGLPAGCS